MAAPIIAELTQTVTDTVGVMKSATALINGFAQRLADAIAEALKNGATAEELAPLVALETDLENEKNALAAAVAANP